MVVLMGRIKNRGMRQMLREYRLVEVYYYQFVQRAGLTWKYEDVGSDMRRYIFNSRGFKVFIIKHYWREIMVPVMQLVESIADKINELIVKK